MNKGGIEMEMDCFSDSPLGYIGSMMTIAIVLLVLLVASLSVVIDKGVVPGSFGLIGDSIGLVASALNFAKRTGDLNQGLWGLPGSL